MGSLVRAALRRAHTCTASSTSRTHPEQGCCILQQSSGSMQDAGMLIMHPSLRQQSSACALRHIDITDATAGSNPYNVDEGRTGGKAICRADPIACALTLIGRTRCLRSFSKLRSAFKMAALWGAASPLLLPFERSGHTGCRCRASTTASCMNNRGQCGNVCLLYSHCSFRLLLCPEACVRADAVSVHRTLHWQAVLLKPVT